MSEHVYEITKHAKKVCLQLCLPVCGRFSMMNQSSIEFDHKLLSVVNQLIRWLITIDYDQ